MTSEVEISPVVNGEIIIRRVEPRLSLADFLRGEGLTGTHLGCEHGVCGACTICVDSKTVRACLMFAVQCDGRKVETIEGATKSGRIQDLQDAFVANNALQCGFCTPAMLLTADEFLRTNLSVSRTEIRAHLSGNYCRCTGYQSIVDAIEHVAKQRAQVKL